MPVPDEVIFGPDAGGSLNYGQVRALQGDKRYRALKRRLDSFLVEQTNVLGKTAGGTCKVYSPFPLFLLTCVSIETLGKALHLPLHIQSEEDAQREGFLTVVGMFDHTLPRQLSKAEKAQYDILWGSGEHSKVRSKAHIIYRFGRHTMVHGFRGKGVYLTEGLDQWEFRDGAVVINPYWFWRTFLSVYEKEWNELFLENEKTGSRKRSADQFLNEILN